MKLTFDERQLIIEALESRHEELLSVTGTHSAQKRILLLIAKVREG